MGGVFKYEESVIHVTAVIDWCKFWRTVVKPIGFMVAQKGIGIARA